MKKIINLTPHTITVKNGDEEQSFESAGVARVDSKSIELDAICGIPTQKTKFGDVYGLPEEKADTMYIVSAIVLARLPERKDLLSPATGPKDSPLRDENGRIVAVTRFNRN